MPIIEPEVLFDWTHDIKKCAEISEKVYNAIMNQLITQGVLHESMILKLIMTNLESCSEHCSPPYIAIE